MFDKSIFENEKMWSGFAYIYFVLRTLALGELVDVIVFGKPFATLFLLIVGICYYGNLQLYKLFKKIFKKKKENIDTWMMLEPNFPPSLMNLR